MLWNFSYTNKVHKIQNICIQKKNKQRQHSIHCDLCDEYCACTFIYHKNHWIWLIWCVCVSLSLCVYAYSKVRLFVRDTWNSSQFVKLSISIETFDFNQFIFFVFSFVCSFTGWYFVWKFFLSRFRLVRELLGQISDSSPSPNASSSKTSDNKKGGKGGKKTRRD